MKLTLLILFTLASLILNIVLFYQLLDKSVTFDYQQTALQEQQQTLESCKTIFSKGYKDFNQFLKIANQTGLNITRVENDSKIQVGEILFEFSPTHELTNINLP